MFNAYDRVTKIVFDDGNNAFIYPWNLEIYDYEDYFILETQVEIGNIKRGWLGNIKIELCGYNYDDICNPVDNTKKEFEYNDVLCVRRIFDFDHGHAATFKYTFNKY